MDLFYQFDIRVILFHNHHGFTHFYNNKKDKLGLSCAKLRPA